jgi:23S rRNA (adenine-C8)-methyltransferase
MDFQELKKLLEKNNQPKFRLEQIRKAVFEDGVSSFMEISVLPQTLRDILEKEIQILPFEVEKVLVAENKDSVKALVKLNDGGCIETVLLSSSNGWTTCISSQAGCPLGCAFCATGGGGFKRNLTTDEITGQILFWCQYLKTMNQKPGTVNNISNIVYMGMGEPLLNWENVKESLENLTDPELFGFGSRSISVSTAGIPEGMEKFFTAFPQINLALSLHFPDDEKRSRFMPINKQYDLKKIRETLKKYFTKSKRKIFIEYILFQDLNDSLTDARLLSEYLKSIGHAYLLHVNLIIYNDTSKGESKNFKPSSKERVASFKECLEKNGINVTQRKSLGQEIQGACGQLAGQV